MPFLKKVNRTYHLQTNISRETLITNLQSLIDKAKRDTKWFSLANVDYRQMKLDANRLIIDREGITVNSLKGQGVITVTFEQANDNITVVKAEIKPMITALWLHAVIVIFICAFILSKFPQGQTALGILILLPIAVVILRFTIANQRWRLESYLDYVLSDLGIKEEMIENT